MEKSVAKRAQLEHNCCQTSEEIIQEQNQVIENLKARNQKLEEVLEEVLKNSESSAMQARIRNLLVPVPVPSLKPQAIQGGQVIQLGNPAAANTFLGNVQQHEAVATSTASTTTGNSGNQNIIMMVPGATEMLEEEPLYVNAKQYHRILKRRQARAKLEAEGRIPKEGKKLRILLPRAL